jgi:UDP-N-acetylglucosamine--dolichyl-phosphate N-acetylglucosaminephosphotransferase
MLGVLLSILLSFVLTIAILPDTIRLLREKGNIAIDVHKYGRPEVPKGAGFVLLFAVVTTLLGFVGVTTFSSGQVNPGILAALVSILMAGMIGQLDDNLDFRNRTKIILPLIASIPMIAMQVGTTTMNIPFIGPVNLGIFYPLIVVPLMMTFIIDSTNMYGGMNGLETGLASINASAVVVYVILSGIISGQVSSIDQIASGVVAGALLGAAMAFFIFNRYPAKVIPGDVGRLPLGAAMAAALILGNMDRLAIFLYLTYGVNFLLYLLYRIHARRTGEECAKFAEPTEEGTLEVAGPYTMYWVLPHFSDTMTEKKNVRLLMLLQAIIAYAAVFFLLFGLPFIMG